MEQWTGEGCCFKVHFTLSPLHWRCGFLRALLWPPLLSTAAKVTLPKRTLAHVLPVPALPALSPCHRVSEDGVRAALGVQSLLPPLLPRAAFAPHVLSALSCVLRPPPASQCGPLCLPDLKCCSALFPGTSCTLLFYGPPYRLIHYPLTRSVTVYTVCSL